MSQACRCNGAGTIVETEMLGDGPIRHVYPCSCADDADRYFVCDVCAHTWSDREHPARCERCRRGASWITEFAALDDAEEHSEHILTRD